MHKILYITYEPPLFPGGSGGQTRQYHLIKELSDRYEFHYVGVCSNPLHQEKLRELFAKVFIPQRKGAFGRLRSSLAKRVNRDFPTAVRKLEGERIHLEPLIKHALQQEQYDLIHVEHSNIAHWLHRIDCRIPRLLVAQNVKTTMWERYAAQADRNTKAQLAADARLFRIYESRFIRDYSMVVVVSDVDKTLLQQLVGDAFPIAIVPNGVNTEYFRPDHSCILPYHLVFTGTMNHPPNSEAAIYFVKKILPKIKAKIPQVTFSIIGSSPTEEVLALDNGSSIKVTGFVEDTRPYLAAAHIVVVPLLTGSGTRLKIMEAMAMGKAVVSTSIGAEGIAYTQGENIQIADNPDTFAASVIALMADQKSCEALGAQARKFVGIHYEWNSLAAKLDKIYRTVIYDKKGPCASRQERRSS